MIIEGSGSVLNNTSFQLQQEQFSKRHSASAQKAALKSPTRV